MIESIRIQNFKAFEDSGELSIKPLTLLVGPNSSGKSSVLQALLMLRQTADSRDTERDIVVNGAYTELGSYKDFVFRQELERSVSISLGIKKRFPFPLRRNPAHKISQLAMWRPALVSLVPYGYVEKFNLMCSFVSRQRGKIMHLNEVTVSFQAPPPVPVQVNIQKKRASKGGYSVSVWSGDVSVPLKPPVLFRAMRHAKFYDFTPQPRIKEVPPLPLSEEAALRSDSLVLRLARQTETALQSIYYLGPLRAAPRRLYWAAGEAPQDVGLGGEDMLAVMWGAQTTKQGKIVMERVNHWMKDFGIASQVQIKVIDVPYFYLLFKDAHTDVPVNLADVGFGASQVLPLIVQGYYSPPQSTFLVEQPEIHLHPRAQSTLADLLIDIAKGDKKLLIETHSEHLLYRVQRRIADNTISRNDVAIYFFEPSESGTKIKEIKLNPLGQFEGAGLPAGFLDEAYEESKTYTEELAKKRATFGYMGGS